jgi:hypothetical protein
MTRRSVWSICEATTGSLSAAMIEVSSANVAVIVPGDVGRSAVYSRYKSGPNTLPCGTPALMGVSGDCSVPMFMMKCHQRM